MGEGEGFAAVAVRAGGIDCCPGQGTSAKRRRRCREGHRPPQVEARPLQVRARGRLPPASAHPQRDGRGGH